MAWIQLDNGFYQDPETGQLAYLANDGNTLMSVSDVDAGQPIGSLSQINQPYPLESLTNTILQGGTLSDADFQRWFELAYMRPYAGEDKEAVLSGFRTQQQQAMADSDFFDDPFEAILDPIANAIEPVGDAVMAVGDAIDPLIADDLGGAVLQFASLFGAPLLSEVGALSAAETIPELGLIADPSTAAGVMEATAGIPELGLAEQTLGGAEGALTEAIPELGLAEQTVSGVTTGTGGASTAGGTAMDDWFGLGEEFWNDLGTQWEGAAAESSLQNAALAEAAGLIPTGTLSSVLGDVQKAASLLNTAKSLLNDGSPSVLDSLLKLGFPAGLLAGLLEDTSGPLDEQLRQAAEGALSAVQRYGQLSPIPLTPSQLRAIEMANLGAGSWQGYMDQAGALTDDATARAQSTADAWQGYMQKAGLNADEARALTQATQGGWQPYLDRSAELADQSAALTQGNTAAWQAYLEKAGLAADEAKALAAKMQGGWKPFLDKAGALADRAGQGIAGMWDPLESTCRHASLSIL